MKKPAGKKVSKDGAAQDKESGVVVVSQSSSSKRLTKRKAKILGVVLVVVAIGTFTAYELFKQDPNADPVTPAQRYLEQAKAEEKPTDQVGKVTYYARLGTTYYDAGDYQKALNSFLEADKYITPHKPDTEGGRSVNLGIAQTYAKLGDKTKAREYYERELSRLQQNSSNEGVDEVIKAIKEQESNL